MATSLPTASQNWAYLSSFFTAVAPVYARSYIETRFKRHVVMGRFMQQNRIDTAEAGGQGIIKRLAIGENPTIKIRSPRADPPMQQNEFMTQAFWPWGSMTGSLSFYDDDIKKCQGEAQLIAWIEPQINQAMSTIDKQMSWWVCQGNTGRTDDPTKYDKPADTVSNLILGLRDGISAGTAQIPGGTLPANPQAHPLQYGGIASDDWTNQQVLFDWQANLVDGSALGSAGLLSNLERMTNNCVHGEYPIDFIGTDQPGYELYKSLLWPNVRYNDFDHAGDTTFEALLFKNLPIVWDVDLQPWIAGQDNGLAPNPTQSYDNANSSRYYGVASQSMRFWWNPDWNYTDAIEKDFRYPENGFRRSKLINLQCQFICEDRRSNGLLYNVPSAS